MMDATPSSAFPRALNPRERALIDWILPRDRSGYNLYRDRVAQMIVLGPGRRGEGELILGKPGGQPELSAPLPPVFAYGAVETSFGTISITLREILDDQISVEIVSHRSDHLPSDFEESHRWTYSTWNAGSPCPQCGGAIREVRLHSSGIQTAPFVLAICRRDRRIWVNDPRDEVNRLIPVTNFYNEIMLHKNIRDPRIALDSGRLFTDLASFSDDDLTYAFITYNKFKARVVLSNPIERPSPGKPGLAGKIKRLFSSGSQNG